jgi:hypothetical protein
MKKLFLIIAAATYWQLYGCENGITTHSIPIVETMHEFEKEVRKLPPEETILFYDIDQTIGYMTNEPGDSRFKLLEAETPEIIKRFQQDKYWCCALTGRSKEIHALTKAQLAQHGIDFSLSTPFTNAMNDDIPNLPRNVGLLDGIIYTEKYVKASILLSYMAFCKAKYVRIIEDKDEVLYRAIAYFQRPEIKCKGNFDYQGFLYTYYGNNFKPKVNAYKHSSTQGMANP